MSAQSSEPTTLYFIGIVAPNDPTHLIGIVGAIGAEASAKTMAHSIGVGYDLIPDCQRRGIAKSALLAYLAAVLTPQITELTATVDPENLPSIRLREA